MEVRKEITVNQAIDQVWDILGNQYASAYKWARGLYHSEGFGKPKLAGASCNNRTCDTSFGVIQEEIRTFDTQKYILEYEVIKGFPRFIKQGVNKWNLTKVDAGRTKVMMHFKGEMEYEPSDGGDECRACEG